jgi:hypothetical protein
VAATPEIVSERHLLAARTSPANTAAPVAPAAPPTAALAEPAGPVAAPPAAALAQAPPTASPAATPGRSRGSETRLAGRMEVAPWATGGSGQRLEAVPEGPPPVSRVEYVLDRVEMNRNPVALPASVVVQDGSVTF